MESENWFERFRLADSEQTREALKLDVERVGYYAYFELLEHFRKWLRQYEDHEIEECSRLIQLGRELFPEIIRLSPSWQRIWDELEELAGHKNRVLQQTAASDREGEWQIVMDNPYTNQNVACYPSLSFLEAAYLFGYFRPGLEKNEYIRLQKIHNAVVEYGD